MTPADIVEWTLAGAFCTLIAAGVIGIIYFGFKTLIKELS